MSENIQEQLQKQLENFLEKLLNRHLYLSDILQEIVPFWEETYIPFVLGMKENNYLYIIEKQSKNSSLNTVIIENTDENMNEDYFAQFFLGEKLDNYIIRFKNVSPWIKSENKNISVYYFAAIPKNEKFSYMFLNLVEREYFEWFLWITFINNQKLERNNITISFASKENLYDRIEKAFKKYIQELFNINLNVITGISGLYYEGRECCASLSFCFSKPDNMDIEFKKHIELDTSKARKIRKLMQVVQTDQSLVVHRNYNESRWEIIGIMNVENCAVSCITFRFFHHMVWNMEFEDKIVVIYDSGKYKIDFNELKADHFCVKYRQIFKNEPSDSVKFVVRHAMEQINGTMVLVVDENSEEGVSEIGRLFADGIGIDFQDVKPEQIQSIIRGMTAIDGTVILGNNGTLYGMGVILDNDVKYEGRSERGARYNSAYKYILSCKDKQLAVMAIVVSADRTVDILTTLDVKENEVECIDIKTI